MALLAAGSENQWIYAPAIINYRKGKESCVKAKMCSDRSRSRVPERIENSLFSYLNKLVPDDRMESVLLAGHRQREDRFRIQSASLSKLIKFFTDANK
jgi:hypothetical protein